MSTLKRMRQHREWILEIAESKGIHNIQIFGSVAREEDTESSDIDLLVTIDRNRSLFDLIEFKYELEGLLGKTVDVGTDLHPFLEGSIKEDVLPL
jgi:uncharacterized protein